MSFDDDETLDEMESIELTDGIAVESFESSYVNIGGVTHRGAVRPRNEDQFAIIRRSRRSELLACSLEEEDLVADREEQEAYMLVVADGLGGQVSGQIASATAVRAVLKFAAELSSWIMRPMGGLREDLEERIGLYRDAINREMQAQVEANPSLAGMATTMTSAYLFGEHAAVVNVGDSRSYLIRDDELRQITEDHTLAQQLRDSGLPAEFTHAYRNVLTRCFDTSGQPASFDLFMVKLKPNDRLLLCSDGLTDMVSDSELLQVIRMAESTSEACRMLAATALRNGGKDNITLVLAQLVDQALADDAEEEEQIDTLDSTLPTLP
jgi:protein phosphatase